MKTMKNITQFIFLLLTTFSYAQDIAYTFENPQITNDGTDSFYEVDIMVTSTADLKVGTGQFYINYNTAAFGTLVDTNGTGVFDATGAMLGNGFWTLVTNDNTNSRVSYAFVQLAPEVAYGPAQTINSVPKLLVRFKAKYIVGQTGVDPMITFETGSIFRNLHFTACGGSFGADCFSFPGTQILIDSFDNSGSAIPTSVSYIWELGAWSPQDPSGIATTLDTIEIRTSGAVLTADTVIGSINVFENGTLNLGTQRLTLHGLFEGEEFISLTGTLVLADGASIDTDIRIENLEVDSGLGSALLSSSDVEVLNLLTLTSGTLNTTSSFLQLKSSASGTAMVDIVGTGTINGDVTVERFVPGKRAFRFISSAVTTSTSILDNWQERGANPGDFNYEAGFGTHITGSAAGSNGFDATGSGNPSLFGYDNINQSWTTITNTDVNTLSAGTPYRLFVRGSRAVDLTTNTPTADETVLRATGTLATGDVTLTNLGVNPGEFNFIGNPYQASVNMNAVLAASTNINSNFYYVWDPQLGARGAYATVMLPTGTNTSGSAANQFLQPGQAAFVSTAVAGVGTMLFQEAHKAVGQNTAVFSTPVNTSSIVGQLFRKENGVVEPAVQDSFGIYFDGAATNAVDLFDASKLSNQDESIAVQYGTALLAIDHRQLPATTETIQLNHTTYRTTAYRYKIEVNNIVGKQFFLVDSYLGDSTLLTNGVNYYDFTIDLNNSSSDAERFSLRIENQTLGLGEELVRTETKLIPNPVTSDIAEITISGASFETPPAVSVFSLTGQKLLDLPLEFSNSTVQLTGLSQLAKGSYFLIVKAGKIAQTLKFIKQ